MSAPLYDDGVNRDIQGEPFPPHVFMPPMSGAHGSCAYVWRDRPCTLDENAKLHRDIGLLVDVLRSPTRTALQPLLDEALALVTEKDRAYAGAWRRQGYMGNVSRVLSKVERLRELVWGDDVMALGDTVGGETVEDTLLDLINLSAMTLHNFRAGDRWGNDGR